mgnify:CR=1 FL=1
MRLVRSPREMETSLPLARSEAQAAFAGRIEHLRVADVMDAEPVAIPEDWTLADAEQQFFLRYGWPWFPVIDSYGRLVGVVSREAVASLRPLSVRKIAR